MENSAEPFALDTLGPPALFIFFAGSLITYRFTRRPYLSLFIAMSKASIFIIYYGILFDGTFTFLDDHTYLKKGGFLLDRGISVVNLFNHYRELLVVGGGPHFSYYLYNADSFRLFGEGYYAPVALNITLTFLAAGFMAAAAHGSLDFSRRLTAGFFVYMSLQPSVIGWSTIMNGKDTLVLTCTALAVYAVSLSERRHYGRAAIATLVAGMVLLFTRFYVPLLMISALLGARILAPGPRRLVSGLLVSVAILGMVSFLGVENILGYSNTLKDAFVMPIYGIPRMLLTPIPFHTTESYAFLNLPQAYYWALFPIMVYGITRVRQCFTLTARFILAYFLIAVFLYGTFGELQGPRHRYQLELLISLFQFRGLLGILKKRFPLCRLDRSGRGISVTAKI